ncbi:TetR-like C-terminal domain-containing protein [Lentzea sp. DG1S-22]|uniref:TetR-like C-terminal domain-containing protein n=1 Tax=Lentzea sp. DG1S-22 TaxID=3108822 RepID=UPI002E7749B2|nr:TetR-like C-terminal domain-containing protein [Lentzea sp. DG1S-22]WVH82992.1 TetR-like C-terminal domain-containing protein [Lentzea sp. DG1S-22]
MRLLRQPRHRQRARRPARRRHPIAEFLSRPEGTALARAAIGTGATSDIASLAAHRMSEQVSPVFAIAERARARGEWREDADPHQVIFTLVGAIMHRVLLEHADPTGPWLDSLVDLVHRGTERPGSGT